MHTFYSKEFDNINIYHHGDYSGNVNIVRTNERGDEIVEQMDVPFELLKLFMDDYYSSKSDTDTGNTNPKI